MDDDPIGKGKGYVLFYRAAWDDPDFKDGNPFTPREAWFYIFTNLANGIDRNGLPRGDFQASTRFLSKKWRWDQSKVRRFLKMLEGKGKIIRHSCNQISVTHQTTQEVTRYTVCKYSTYQDARLTKRLTKRLKSNESIKESIKEEETTSGKTFITLTLKTGEEYPVTEEKVAQFKECFPSVDVEAQLFVMKSWCINNPAKQKTRSGICRFMNRWLTDKQETAKAQNTILNFTSSIGAMK